MCKPIYLKYIYYSVYKETKGKVKKSDKMMCCNYNFTATYMLA